MAAKVRILLVKYINLRHYCNFSKYLYNCTEVKLFGIVIVQTLNARLNFEKDKFRFRWLKIKGIHKYDSYPEKKVILLTFTLRLSLYVNIISTFQHRFFVAKTLKLTSKLFTGSGQEMSLAGSTKNNVLVTFRATVVFLSHKIHRAFPIWMTGAEIIRISADKNR